MKYKLFLIALMAALLMAVPAWAQSTNPYDLTWLTFAGGSSSGGPYQMTATFGQLDNQPATGGAYSLSGRLGIGGATATPSPTLRLNLYLPVVRR